MVKPNLIKLFSNEQRQTIYDAIMSNARSNSIESPFTDAGKWIGLDFLEDILTVHILRAGKEVDIESEKLNIHNGVTTTIN